jgi:geranylgeranyl pyrophosphate synthase
MGKPTGKDSSRGKLTFPGVLGAEASTERARQLIDEACQALTALKPHTTALEGLAHYVLDRHH